MVLGHDIEPGRADMSESRSRGCGILTCGMADSVQHRLSWVVNSTDAVGPMHLHRSPVPISPKHLFPTLQGNPLSRVICSDITHFYRDNTVRMVDSTCVKNTLSKLAPFEEEIRRLRGRGVSLRTIADHLKQEHGLAVTYNAVFSFLKTRDSSTRQPSPFFRDLPADIRDGLIKQLTALWTFDSTGIDGNTLTLGETIKVIELGLTVSGKPLKDHEEVYGHAKGVDLIFDLIERDSIEKKDLFDLHRCVMQKSPIDSLRPIGDWKRDFNGTTGVRDGKPVYMEYASPADTPALMSRWIKEFNRKLRSATSTTRAINVYAWSHLSFVRIHPFFDGNGRVARLIANLPLLKCGHPPLLISLDRRVEYIDRLWEYENAVGIIESDSRLLPLHACIGPFKALLREEWRESAKLVADACQQAASRGARSRDRNHRRPNARRGCSQRIHRRESS